MANDMDIRIWYIERPEGPKAGPGRVGWFLDRRQEFDRHVSARTGRCRDTNRSHAKSAARSG